MVSNVRPFEDDKFFLMERCEAREVTGNTYGKRIDQILLEFFHVGSLRNADVEDTLSKIWDHLSKKDQDSVEYKALKDWLKNRIDNGDMELARIKLEEIKQRKAVK